MASHGYLPDRDPALLAWAISASALISATPTAFGLTTAIATGFATCVTNFQAALEASQPGVRSKATTLAKNNARAALRANIKLWASLVDGTSTVTNVQRTQLGLNVRAKPTPRPAPTTPPVLEVKAVNGRTVTVRLHDSTGTRRGKAANAVAAFVYSYVGATPPASVDDWRREGTTGKTTFDVAFSPTLAPGATVYLTACWVGTRFESGPACEPVGVTFGSAGLSQPAA